MPWLGAFDAFVHSADNGSNTEATDTNGVHRHQLQRIP
jgi:hypothetical protein